LKPAGTITRNDGNIGMHGMMHWAERRRLTLAEARIVAGFPASFAFPGGWADGMHQIGNCVPPPLTEAVARQLISTLASRTM
jgi:DNA (cytosine-5)-methyltransferase 1